MAKTRPPPFRASRPPPGPVNTLQGRENIKKGQMKALGGQGRHGTPKKPEKWAKKPILFQLTGMKKKELGMFGRSSGEWVGSKKASIRCNKKVLFLLGDTLSSRSSKVNASVEISP